MDLPNLIESLKKTRAWEKLSQSDSALASKAITFVSAVAPILDTIVDYFPNYTNHDGTHSLKIVERYGDILKDECFQDDNSYTLTSTEIYLLICSAFAHDLGMTVFPGEKDKILHEQNVVEDSHWMTNKNLQTFLRKTHSTRGYDYLVNHEKEMHIPSHLLSYLNFLMAAHNESTESLRQKTSRKQAADHSIINLPQLAAILCVADAIEFSDTRVKDEVIERLLNKSDNRLTDDELVSLHENLKHSCISSNLAVDPVSGVIIVNGTFTLEEVANLAHHTLDDIEEWLRDYIEIDSSYSHARLKIKAQIIRGLEVPNSQFERLGIRMRKDNIIQLITSNSVWQNRAAIPLKELLQNSVEACRYRLHHSSQADNYKPAVQLNFNKAANTIVVEDNGCGMNRHVILNHFLTVGNSRSFDPAYLKGAYTSLARFGIGFWSVFTIAAKVEVVTKDFVTSDHALAFAVSVEKMKDYVVFRNTTRDIGTTITIHLKPTVNMNEIVGKLRYELVYSRVPISIIVNATEYSIPQEINLPTRGEIFGPWLQRANEIGVRTFTYRKEDENYSFAMYLNYLVQDGEVTFFADNDTVASFKPSLAAEMLKTSVMGFQVNAGSSFSVFSLHVGHCVADIKNPKGIEFTLNRLGLVDTEERANFLTAKSMFLHEAYYQWLKENNSLSPETVYRLNMESRKSIRGDIALNRSHFFNTIDAFPDLVIFKLYKIETSKTLGTASTMYLKYSEFVSITTEIVSYGSAYSPAAKVHIDENKAAVVYEIIKQNPSLQNKFFHEPTNEFTLIWSMAKHSYLVKINVESPIKIVFPLKVIHPYNVDPSNNVNDIITTVQGQWSGSVVRRSVIGGSFAFSYHTLFVTPDSKLSNDLENLAKEGDVFAIAEIAHFLSLAQYGIIDEKVKDYL